MRRNQNTAYLRTHETIIARKVAVGWECRSRAGLFDESDGVEEFVVLSGELVGVGLDGDDFVAELENGDDALDVVGDLAGVDVGDGAGDVAGGEGEAAALDGVFVGADGGLKRGGADGDAEGVDGRAADGLDFAWVEVGFEIVAV